MFGSNKTISAYVGEHLASKELLEFVACSSHCQGLVIGQTLHKKHRQVRANATPMHQGPFVLCDADQFSSSRQR